MTERRVLGPSWDRPDARPLDDLRAVLASWVEEAARARASGIEGRMREAIWLHEPSPERILRLHRSYDDEGGVYPASSTDLGWYGRDWSGS